MERLCDPCAKHLFGDISNTDPVAVSVSTYGCGLFDDKKPDEICGLVTGLGGISKNITEFCASDEGGNSNVLNVFAAGPPSCSPKCGETIQAYIPFMGCCNDQVLFEEFYRAAGVSLPTKLRPPMALYKQRIAQACGFPVDTFPARCGAENKENTVFIKANFFNAKASYLQKNSTEAVEVFGRTCMEAARYVGAAPDACTLVSGFVPSPTLTDTMEVTISINMESPAAARAASIMLRSSPVQLRSACRYVMRRVPDAVF